MFRVCVFAGSLSPSQTHQLAAAKLGKALVERGIGIVYGGGAKGMMGALATAAATAGGRVVGVVPVGLWPEELNRHEAVEIHITRNMRERKALMATLADAFIALPGGLGTLDELFEVLTQVQLGIHNKPIGVFDSDGYFSRLVDLLNHVHSSGYSAIPAACLVHYESDPARLIDKLVLASAQFDEPAAASGAQRR
jgi:uncharacterized protein (TIGR00730 family)